MFGWREEGVRVREGAHYLTKCGTIVGPAIYEPASVSPGRNWKIGTCHYHGNGTAFGRHEGWDLELIGEIPAAMRGLIVGREDHDRALRAAQRRIHELEMALVAFSGLSDAIKVASSIPSKTTVTDGDGVALIGARSGEHVIRRTETAQQPGPSTDINSEQTAG